MPKRRMGIDQRFNYLGIQYDRYKEARRKEKGELLTETVEVTGLDRKTVIRRMGKRPIKRRQPRRRYHLTERLTSSDIFLLT